MLRDVVVIDDRVRARSEVFDNAARAATGFVELGLRDNDAVAILMRNDFEFFEASRAAAMMGAYSVPLNWHNKPDELAYVMADSSPSVIVGHADLLIGAKSVIPAGVHVFVVPYPNADDLDSTAQALGEIPGARLFADWLKAFAPWDGAPKPPRSAVIYTSGTTGKPKAVRKPPMGPEALAKFRAAQHRCNGIDRTARAMVLGPLYHSSPDASGRLAVAEAEIAVLLSHFDAEKVLQLIDRHKITHLVMVPTMFVRLVKLPQEIKDRYDVSSVKGVIHTGSPCPPDIKRAMIEWWGPVINEMYGGTEMGVAFLCSSEQWLKYPGTAGTAMPGTRCVIYGDDGKPLPAGGIGEIFARNPDYGDFEYAGLPEKRREVERDGMITLGDVGYLNEEGFLFLCDRKRDMVISGGTNIYPAEIESVLVTHPDVRDCAVFGVPDDDLGETLVAAVERKPGTAVSEEELRAFLKERLTNYKVPRAIEFHAALPREESGKLFKRKLRDPRWEGRTRAI